LVSVYGSGSIEINLHMYRRFTKSFCMESVRGTKHTAANANISAVQITIERTRSPPFESVIKVYNESAPL
jgi:hypothetical protein